MNNTWESPIYRETALIVLAFLFVSGLIVFLLRKKNYYSSFLGPALNLG